MTLALLNIDYDLIETVETDRIALSNGCVCCTLNDDLVQSIAEFCRSDPPDAFMIEASGVADPRALDASLQALAQAGLAHAQSRVYVLDADQFGGLDYADTEDLVDHAAASDLIVLNKADLVGTERMAKIVGLLARSAPGVELHETSYGQLSFTRIEQNGRAVTDGFERAHNHPRKTGRYETYAFEDIPPLSPARFDQLTDLLKSMCLRAKGVVYIADMGNTTLKLQLVGQRIDLQSIERSASGNAKLVTISWRERIDRTVLEDILGTASKD